MNNIFEILNGGIVFEVGNLKEALIAEQSGASALLLEMNASPIHPDSDSKVLEEILSAVTIPLISSFRPGHFVEAEILNKMGVWGVYSDMRFEEVFSNKNPKNEKINYPLLVDIESFDEISNDINYIPVLRKSNIEDLVQELKNKKEILTFVTGPIETVSDIALIKRMEADVIILPRTVFEFDDSKNYLPKLVKASFYYNDTEKLAEILEDKELTEGQ